MTSLTRCTFQKVAGTAGVVVLAGCGAPGARLNHLYASLRQTGALLPYPRRHETRHHPDPRLYAQSYAVVPDVIPDRSRLHAHGLVERKMTLTLDDVRRFPGARNSGRWSACRTK